MRSFAMRLAGACPVSIKRWLYDHPRVLRPLSRWLKKSVPAEGFTVVTIPAGPNQGLKLAVTRTTPNYYWLNEAYEPHVLTVLQDSVRAGMTVLDIGAHIGFDTMLLSRLVGENGKVIAFEPDPANFSSLTRNCQLNDLKHVQLNRQAVADRSGSLSFAADGLTTSHLVTAPASDPSIITVPAVTLDQWRQETGLKPDFIKIDVENHEAAVLRGAAALLKHDRPILLIEIHSPESLAACAAILRAAGYRMRALPESDYYRAVLNDAPADAGGFEIAHLLAEPENLA